MNGKTHNNHEHVNPLDIMVDSVRSYFRFVAQAKL